MLGVCIGIILFIIAELILDWLVYRVREDFQWFITPEDENPKRDLRKWTKFLKHGGDTELGWVRKPNTNKKECGTEYHINNKGARNNPNHEKLPSTISTYGDSFTFCRQNNDDTTWQWYLSELTETNVLNFGVGNYGLDQALLRLKREYPKNPTDTVIIGVVPSTIVRNMCMWKHYNEYGNIFGFKPMFKIDRNKNLKFIPRSIDVEFLKKNDMFYKSKFRKEMLRFPLIFHFFKKPFRNIPIAYWVMTGQKEKAMMKIQRINLKLRKSLYRDWKATRTFDLLVREFIKYSEEMNFKPVLVMLPQKDDITCKHNYYKSVLSRFNQDIRTIDMRDYLFTEDFDSMYSDDNEYGGHFNSKGNHFIAEQLSILV